MLLLKASPPVLHINSFKFSNAGGIDMKPTRRSRRGVIVRTASAGYTKRPPDTTGAYQLIDEDTGEKFIVSGGTDDDRSFIPSKQVRNNNNNDAAIKTSHDITNLSASAITGSEASSNGLATSFGRLKAHRVRVLGRISSSKREGKNGDLYDEPVVSGGKRRLHTQVKNVGELSKVDVDDPDSAVLTRRGSDSSLRGPRTGESRSTSLDVSVKLGKPSADSDFFSRKSFRDLGCTDYILQFLRSQRLVRPSHIQAMSFTHVINGKSCIIADQSGSGKTLAYLLPVVQSIRQDELQGIAKSLPQCPRVVILVPTSELASQVLSSCRLMSKFGVPFRSMVVTGGFRQRTQLENLRHELDVLIATPGRFLFLVEEGFLQLTNLKCAVLDEVDILFKDEDFQPALQSLMNSSPVLTQYLFVTATLPVNIYNKLIENFPDCEVIMGPGMHRTSSGLEEILIDCSGDDGIEKTPDTAFLNKKSSLMQLVKESPVTKMIIFCNKIETCRKVENALKRCNKRVLPFHAALAQDLRVANMEEFCNCQLTDSSVFLVCTDRASRGIDVPGVDKVVLFDFPRDPSEYVRRVGRTARGAGGKGKAFIFVVGKQVSLARRIISRNRKGHPLHDVPSNI